MRAELVTAPICAAVIACAAWVPGAQAQEPAKEKVIGILFAAGDISWSNKNAPKECFYDKDNEAKTKLRTGEATAELVQQEIARAKGAGVDVQVLALGDLSYPKGESMNCFNKYWGRFKEKILPVLGNHDTMTKDGQAYFDYFKSILDTVQANQKDHPDAATFKLLGNYAVDFPSKEALPKDGIPWRLIGLRSSEDPKQLAWPEG